MMKFGICAGIPQAQTVLDAGYDYVELPAQLLKGNEHFVDLKKLDGICSVMNYFFPGTIKLFETDPTEIREYCHRVLERAGGLGVKLLVIGSGASRNAPDGKNHEEALEDFSDLCGEIQKLAKKYGILISPENLNQKETNVGNDLGVLAKSLKKRGVGFTADCFHLLAEWDNEGREGGRTVPSELYWKEQIPFLPDHVQIADFPSRSAPKASDAMVGGFVKRLKKLGYKGRVSLECKFSNFKDEPGNALKELRNIFGVKIK
jgi:sugar phosphate isomerase/epimerase